MLKFYILHQRQIIEHIDARVHFKSPSTKWWTITFIVMPAINEISKTIIHLQNSLLIIVQQKIKIGLFKDLLIKYVPSQGHH
jgi:hypothetical protein